MAKPIFWRGLAMRCEHSEHGKSQLSLKYFCSILAIFFVIYSVYISTSCLYRSVFFRFPMALHSPALPLTSKGLAQAGLPLPLARAQNLQIRTIFQASHCPACAKPKLGAGIVCVFRVIFLLTSVLILFLFAKTLRQFLRFFYGRRYME